MEQDVKDKFNWLNERLAVMEGYIDAVKISQKIQRQRMDRMEKKLHIGLREEGEKAIQNIKEWLNKTGGKN